MRAAVAAIAALTSCGPGSLMPALASIAQPSRPAYSVDLDAIVFVECGEWTGTGFSIGRGRIVTAAHVVLAKGHVSACTVGGREAHAQLVDPKLDFAILFAPTTAHWPRLWLDCRGFRPGRAYFAIGYAAGRDFAMQVLRARPAQLSGFPEFAGVTYDGMSGGPVVDADGYVAGIINLGDDEATGAEPLSATTLCKK